MRKIISKVSMIIAILMIYLGIEDVSVIFATTRSISLTDMIVTQDYLDKTLEGASLKGLTSYVFIIGIVFLIIFAIINFNHKRKITLIPSICAIATSAYIFISYNFVYFLIFLSISVITTSICNFFHNKNTVNRIFVLLTVSISIAQIVIQIIRILSIKISTQSDINEELYLHISNYSFTSKCLLLLISGFLILNIIYDVYAHLKSKK